MGSVFYRHSQPANDVLKDLFGEKVFDNPKDHEVLGRLVRYCTGNGDLVMDFFSGSSSLPHGVIESNYVDNLRRSFIAVQLPEPCDIKLNGNRAHFETIADLGKDRIRRAGRKLKAQYEDDLILKGSVLDIGLKVLSLDSSNFKPWQSPSKDVDDSGLIQQMELAIDHIDPNATQEDLLYELLIKSGVKPTESIVSIELGGHKVFSVADGSLLVHLEDNIDKALIDAVLAHKPVQFICLDKAFHGNDQLKANAVKTFETYNQGLQQEEPRILFRTV